MSILKKEPALFWTTVGGVLTAASVYFLDVGAGLEEFTALGKALGTLAVAISAGGAIRQTVYSPKTANEIMDAEAVISAAELRGEYEAL